MQRVGVLDAGEDRDDRRVPHVGGRVPVHVQAPAVEHLVAGRVAGRGVAREQGRDRVRVRAAADDEHGALHQGRPGAQRRSGTAGEKPSSPESLADSVVCRGFAMVRPPRGSR